MFVVDAKGIRWNLMRDKKSNEWMDWIKIIVAALLIALIVRKFFFSPIIVDGPSMQPTLHDQDKMIVNKFVYYMKEPERFDIVIFHANNEKDFIKRVIGLPGEHIKVEDNDLYVDNKEVPQSFLNIAEEEEDITYPIITNDFTLENLKGNYDVIAENYYLVLGDNRKNSTDSRSSSVGLVHKDQIVGKTNFIYWPLERIHVVNK